MGHRCIDTHGAKTDTFLFGHLWPVVMSVLVLFGDTYLPANNVNTENQ
jgi:hypothetical protein